MEGNLRTAALLLRSRAKLCIIPMQDWLGLDDKSRINVPSTVGTNWKWQLLTRSDHGEQYQLGVFH